MVIKENNLLPCPFCSGINTLIEYGTRVWLGTRYGDPTHWEVNHWCKDGRSLIKLKANTEEEVIAIWNNRP